MRLTAREQSVITSVILNYDNSAKVFLFGSRVDDNARGGDIDLLVLSEAITFDQKLHILTDLHYALGEQKIDLVLSVDGKSAFAQVALESGIELT